MYTPRALPTRRVPFLLFRSALKGRKKTANSDGMRKCVVPSDILAFVVVHVFSYTFADRYKHAYVGM